MTQVWGAIPSTETLENSRTLLLDRFDTLRSNNAGTAFPTADLFIGMSCTRTDLNEVYTLKSTGPSVWIKTADLDKSLVNLEDLGTAAFVSTGTAGANVPTVTQADARYLRLASGSALTSNLIIQKDLALAQLKNAAGSPVSALYSPSDGVTRVLVYIGSGATTNQYLELNYNGNMVWRGSTVWHAGNDGGGSGLDADLLDAQEGSYYRNASNLNAGTVPTARLPGNAAGARTVSTGAPTGGANGDIWYQV